MTPREAADHLRLVALSTSTPAIDANAIAVLLDHAKRLERTIDAMRDAIESLQAKALCPHLDMAFYPPRSQHAPRGVPTTAPRGAPTRGAEEEGKRPMRTPIDPSRFLRMICAGNPPHAPLIWGFVLRLGGPATREEKAWLRAHGYRFSGGAWGRRDRKASALQDPHEPRWDRALARWQEARERAHRSSRSSGARNPDRAPNFSSTLSTDPGSR